LINISLDFKKINNIIGFMIRLHPILHRTVSNLQFLNIFVNNYSKIPGISCGGFPSVALKIYS